MKVLLPRLPANILHALGGIGVACVVTFTILCVVFEEVRLVGAAQLGGSLVLLGWLILALDGIFRSRYVVINAMATVSLVCWGAFATALGIEPAFREMVMPVALHLGGALIVGVGMFYSIKGIRAKEIKKH